MREGSSIQISHRSEERSGRVRSNADTGWSGEGTISKIRGRKQLGLFWGHYERSILERSQKLLDRMVVCTLFDRAGSLVALSTKAKKFSGGHELQA